jgi:hypothetical protein
MFTVLFYEVQTMALIHDIVLMLVGGAFCLLCAVVAIPLNWVFRKIGYWLADRDFERRHNYHGTKR